MQTANININLNLQNAEDSIDSLNKETKKSLTTIKSLREESEKLNKELEGVEIGTEQYKALSKQLIQVNTQLKNQDLALEALDNEQLASELKSVAGGLSDMAGGLALIGVSSSGIEKIVQTMAKVEGITKAVTGGIEVLSSGMKVLNSLSARGATLQSIFTSATISQTSATEGATIAQTGLNTAMKANPIGIVIGAITALVAAWYMFSNSAGTAEEKTEKLKLENEELNIALENQKIILDQINQAVKTKNTLVSDLKILDIQKQIILAEDKLNDILKNRPGDLEGIKKAQIELNQLNLNLVNQEKEAKLESFDLDIRLMNKRLKSIDSELFKTDTITKEGLDKRAKLTSEYNELLIRLEGYSALEREKIIKESDNKILQQKINNQNRLDEINKDIRDREGRDLKDATNTFIEEAKKKRKITLETGEIITKLNQEYYKDDTNNFKESNEEKIKSTQELFNILSEGWRSLGTTQGNIMASITTSISAGLEVFKTDYIDKVDEITAYTKVAAQLSSQLMGELTNQINQNRDEQLNSLNDIYNSDTKKLQQQLNNRIISQKEYDDKVNKLEEYKAQREIQIKKEAFEKSKQLQLVNATIQTAQAVLAAYSSGAAYPFVGPATGAIFAGIAAAMGAVQIGIIASQQFKAAKGGIVPRNGKSQNEDSVNALLAPGEAVINSTSTAAFTPLLSAINQAGGGTPLISNIEGISSSPITKTLNKPQPIQAYITEQQVTSTQKRIKTIKQNSKLF